MPLLTNQSNILRGFAHASGEVKKAESALAKGKSGYRVTDAYTPAPEDINTAFIDLSKIRSRFAAFNMSTPESRNILAGIGAGALAVPLAFDIDSAKPVE
jgi:hypothetical protein